MFDEYDWKFYSNNLLNWWGSGWGWSSDHFTFSAVTLLLSKVDLVHQYSTQFDGFTRFQTPKPLRIKLKIILIIS